MPVKYYCCRGTALCACNLKWELQRPDFFSVCGVGTCVSVLSGFSVFSMLCHASRVASGSSSPCSQSVLAVIWCVRVRCGTPSDPGLFLYFCRHERLHKTRVPPKGAAVAEHRTRRRGAFVVVVRELSYHARALVGALETLKWSY